MPGLSRKVPPSSSTAFQVQPAHPPFKSVVGAAQGLNQAAQCVGAILIAPLVKKWPTRTVLSAAIIMFSFTAALLLILDAGTGEY